MNTEHRIDRPHRSRTDAYRMRTQLIHGAGDRQRWDFTHHIVPPMSASVAYRLGTVHRGAQGFAEFATAEAELQGEAPIYLYNRLDEPTRGMLEDNLAYADGKAAERFLDAIAAHAYSVTLAVSLGQIRTLIEAPYAMTHAALPEAVLRKAVEVALQPGVSWEDITAALQAGA